MGSTTKLAEIHFSTKTGPSFDVIVHFGHPQKGIQKVQEMDLKGFKMDILKAQYQGIWSPEGSKNQTKVVQIQTHEDSK